MTATGFLEAALEADAAGINVLPPSEDGLKQPLRRGGHWKEYQRRRSTRNEIHRWYGIEERTGVGHICGRISGNAEMLECESRQLYDRFKENGSRVGLGDLIERIEAGWSDLTPGGGIHLNYRCAEIDGNTKLARRPKAPDEMRDEHDTVAVLIETRGEGGFSVDAPSNGKVHPTGRPYVRLAGGPATMATITPDERRDLFDLARTFDRMPRTSGDRPSSTQDKQSGDLKPGEDFNARADWGKDVLIPHGWTHLFTRGKTDYWRRPGKKEGISATTNFEDSGLLYVFSTSTPFNAEEGYSKFRAYAVLNHQSNWGDAARDLAAKGYGTQKKESEKTTPTPPPPVDEWPTLDPAALHGLAGEIVRAIDPHTEADPVAVLMTFLLMYASAVGRTPHLMVGEDRHGVNEFVGLVGQTAKARKGSSRSAVQRVTTLADPDWAKDRIRGGLSSGEGLLAVIADEVKQTNRKGVEEIVVQGTDDKRLLCLEEELSQFLKVSGRQGNIISEVARRAWDARDLGTMTKATPLRVTAPHVSILGHITRDELRQELSEIAAANGTGNRFSWFVVRRSKAEPELEPLSDAVAFDLSRRMLAALQHGRRTGRVRMDDTARAIWRDIYPDLSDGKPGLFGAITARAEAHVLRYSLLYALLDQSSTIGVEHLTAALALWDFSEASARLIFGDATGDPIADRILSALRRSGPMAQTDIMDLFGRNVAAARLAAALETLVTAGRIQGTREETGGRPRQVWSAV